MISIHNLHYEEPAHPWDIRVDRQVSSLGNPYKIRVALGDTRDVICDKYAEWFTQHLADPIFADLLDRLESRYKEYGKLRLFCWCAPKRCHAETIAQYILERMGEVFL